MLRKVKMSILMPCMKQAQVIALQNTTITIYYVLTINI